MSNITDQQLRKASHRLRILPYLVCGFLIFSINSMGSFNYFLRGYSVLLECQAAVVIIYFLIRYFKSKN